MVKNTKQSVQSAVPGPLAITLLFYPEVGATTNEAGGKSFSRPYFTSDKYW